MEDQLYKEDFTHFDKAHFESKKKPSDQSSGNYFCKCSICDLQRKDTIHQDPAIKAKEDYANYEGKEKSFTWLLKELGKASKENSIKLNIPETVVFKKGKPSFLIFQRADRTLKLTTSAQKLKLVEIKKMFSSLARNRKREEFPVMKPARPEAYGKEVALVRYLLRDFDSETGFVPPSYENGALRVMVDIEFSDLMLERAGSPMWKKISYIQSVVKCKMGIGETYVNTYYSHDANDGNAIFELQRAGKDDNEGYEAQIATNIQQYCIFMCRRIAYLLAVHSQKELLRFSPELIIDDNGKIWLVYATRISVKDIEINYNHQEVLFKRVELRNVESKERLNDELNSGATDPKALHQVRMLGEMSRHYTGIKNKMGIDSLFRDKPRDALSSMAFSKLRPFTPYSLYDLIDPEALKKIEEQKFLHKSKSKRMKVIARATSKQNLEQASKPQWSVRKSQVSSARTLNRSSSRFSEHLKSWLTPVKHFSIYGEK